MDFLETTVYRIILRTYMYMERTGRENSFERFPYLRVLTERLTEEALEAWRSDAGQQAQRYWNILGRIRHGGSICIQEESVLSTALELTLAVMYVPEFAAYLNYYTGNVVTVQMAFEMEGILFAGYSDVVCALGKLQKVCWVDWNKNPISYAAVEGNNLLLAYLTGPGSADKELPGQMEWFGQDTDLHPMFIRQDLARRGADWLEEPCANVLQISGRGGRRFLAKHTARLLGRSMLLVNMAKCRSYTDADERRFWNGLVHAAFLREAAVCVYGITGEDVPGFIETAVRLFLEADILVILCTEPNVAFLPDGRFRVRDIRLTETTREEREALLRGFSGLYGILLDSGYYSVRYRLSASEAAKAMETWRHGIVADAKDFSRICDDILYSGQEKIFGTILYPSVGLEDLKVPASIKETLGQICSSVTDGYRIFEEWGLERQYPYGRAVTVLLCGPPGTGKTMTAHVIAKELGLPLYQVDLSLVMDKYIGETEKHLDRIFAFTQRANPVLFFDEADSLFGKRGEVTEGKDRYANMEVSYILQRIEQFDGIVVLATNFYNNIDKAFLRRLKYVLRYQAPDAAIRRSIWEACLPPGLTGERLNMDYLARQFDFAGGTIKNVAYVACVMAVYEGTKPGMEHILRAIRAEYEKMGQLVEKDMWGEYGYLMARDDACRI